MFLNVYMVEYLAPIFPRYIIYDVCIKSFSLKDEEIFKNKIYFMITTH